MTCVCVRAHERQKEREGGGGRKSRNKIVKKSVEPTSKHGQFQRVRNEPFRFNRSLLVAMIVVGNIERSVIDNERERETERIKNAAHCLVLITIARNIITSC